MCIHLDTFWSYISPHLTILEDYISKIFAVSNNTKLCKVPVFIEDVTESWCQFYIDIQYQKRCKFFSIIGARRMQTWIVNLGSKLGEISKVTRGIQLLQFFLVLSTFLALVVKRVI